MLTSTPRRLEVMTRSRCVALGEIGLNYHYDNSPRNVQQTVFRRQLKHAVGLGKPLAIHIGEADEDTERIMKEEVLKDYKIRYLPHSIYALLTNTQIHVHIIL